MKFLHNLWIAFYAILENSFYTNHKMTIVHVSETYLKEIAQLKKDMQDLKIKNQLAE
jgi:hypothetical protein